MAVSSMRKRIKEFNMFPWNDGTPEYDIREWTQKHERMDKGVTHIPKEIRQFYDILRKVLEPSFEQLYELNGDFLMENFEQKLFPVFKWGGGKRQLLNIILSKIPPHKRYYEPFIGGAAVLLGLKPENAVINDFNEELINTYKVIRDHPEDLIRLLELHRDNNSIDYFYEVRSWDRDVDSYSELSNIEKAARTLYLNRTCFNGLYRVNRQGFFNTPCGKYKNPEIVNAERIRTIHEYLSANRIDIRCGDYKDALKYIRAGAFVYFDPPYMPPENGEDTFTQYTVDGFGEDKQKELKGVCDMLTEKGVKFMLSNSCCSFIKDLYRDYHIEIVQARRNVCAASDKRILIDEVLVTNYNT